MPRFAANLSMLFTETPFLDRFEAAAKAGFKAVEFLFPYEHAPRDIRARLDGNGLRQALFNMPPGDFARGERGIAALPGREREFEAGVAKALEYAEALGCRKVHVMAGLAAAGAERATYVANLRRACRSAAAAGVDLLIEPINPRDIPGYFLNTCAEARRVIEDVGAANLWLQFDVYHRQIVQGDIATGLKEFATLIRHVQIANPPDRGEPDEGEINYRSVFGMIDSIGYDGWVGCEYRPRAGTLAGLGWVERCGVSLS